MPHVRALVDTLPRRLQTSGMSVVEDVRQAFQDFLAPELRAMVARLDALEKVMDARFAAQDVKIEAFQRSTDTKFAALDAKIEGLQKSTEIKFGALDSKIQQLTDSLNLDRRLAKLEAQQTSVPQ
jgi:hypothetical protein